MAPAQSKRQSRKRRKPRASGSAGKAQSLPPQPVGSAGREYTPGSLATTFSGKTYGEPPPNMFGGVPVAEIAIFSGGLGALVGLASGAVPALVVGIVVCTLGVIEFTAREHFSGYRSHTTLLAAIPAVGIGVALIALVGGSLARSTLLPVVLAVFGVLFWLLRNRFRSARQGRVVRRPLT
jgi:hypothetical protein